MNIRQAKEEIKRTLEAYVPAEGRDACRIPRSRQRPILLIGPPGIGKTAIMEQIAGECGVGLVSYTMTHHTRQSAIGLPYLTQENFDGREYRITEYTMSEIIASVYRCMRTSGCRRGILFIDEINCVSETLVPVMLQFLQNKMFGMHHVPEGWMIVAAGNPPEYNRSVREFDMVTLDRVRKMEIEADYQVWREYALENGVHPVILSYLSIHPEHFYSVSKEDNGQSFVTARGWEDLSYILRSYEALSEKIDDALVEQYLQHREIADEFTLFYGLFRRYGQVYDVCGYLQESISDEHSRQIYKSFKEASADEAMAVTAMVYDYLSAELKCLDMEKKRLKRAAHFLEALKCRSTVPGEAREYMESQKKAMLIKRDNHLLTAKEAEIEQNVIQMIRRWLTEADTISGEELHGWLRQQQERMLQEKRVQEKALTRKAERGFELLEAQGKDNLYMIRLALDLSRQPLAASFFIDHFCEKYSQCCELLLTDEREERLRREIEKK